MDKRYHLVDIDNEKEVLAIAYAISGASFAAILALTSFSSLSKDLQNAMYCFSVSLPSAWAFATFLRHVVRGEWSTPASRFASVALGKLTYVSAWAGIALLFRHMSHIAMWIFLGLSAAKVIACIPLIGMYRKTCDRLHVQRKLEMEQAEALEALQRDISEDRESPS